ncbi:MAG: hypothetical protein Q9187_000504, partial [Circinaria calcarea]
MANSTGRQGKLDNRPIERQCRTVSKENQRTVLKHRSSEPSQQQGKRRLKPTEPSPAEPSPVESFGFETDPTIIKGIWEDVRNHLTLTTTAMKTQSGIPSTAHAKGSLSYNTNYLKPRRINIFTYADNNDSHSELDNVPTRRNLGPFYVDHDDKAFLEDIISNVEIFIARRENEGQWESNIYSWFLRPNMSAPGYSEPDAPSESQDPNYVPKDNKASRQIKPGFSLISPDGKILLPPMDDIENKRRKSANSLPPKEGTEKHVSANRSHIFPDMIFAPRAYKRNDNYQVFHTGRAYPAIRNLHSLDLYPPYLIVENKPTDAQETEARQPIALLAAMLLFERLKLRVIGGNYRYQNLCIFIITCCGPSVTIWKMSFAGEEKDEGCLIGYKLYPIGEYNIINRQMLTTLCQRINNIHLYGLTTHKFSILADLNASVEKRLHLEDLDLLALRVKKVGTEFVVEAQRSENTEDTLDSSLLTLPKAPSNPASNPLSPARQNNTGGKYRFSTVSKSLIPISCQRNRPSTPSNAALGKRPSNGQSGLELSVVLMDQEMPVMDGLICTRKIRELQEAGEITEHVPIIAVTVNARDKQIAQLLLVGMDDVVSKPFRIPELMPKMEDLVTKDEREGMNRGPLFGLAHRMADGVADEQLVELGQGEKSTAEWPQTLSFDSKRAVFVISIGEAHVGETKSAFLEDLRYALMEVGFFYISNTGIENALTQDVITQGKRFFDLPEEKKLEVQMKNAASFLGTNARIKLIPRDGADLQVTTNSAMKSRGIRLIGVNKSTFQLRIRFHCPAPPSTTTSSPPTNGQIQLSFPHSGRLIAEALDLPATAFDRFFDADQQHKLKVVKYPDIAELGVAEGVESQGVGPHKDSMLTSYLLQASHHHGLQAQNMAGEWIDCPPIAGTLVVAIGQGLEAITHG